MRHLERVRHSGLALLLTLVALLAPGVAGALELNDASRAQLEQLSGVGVDTAERILQERGKAPFRDWSDLQQRVKGISGKRLAQLQAQGLRVNGLGAPPQARPDKDGK